MREGGFFPASSSCSTQRELAHGWSLGRMESGLTSMEQSGGLGEWALHETHVRFPAALCQALVGD